MAWHDDPRNPRLVPRRASSGMEPRWCTPLGGLERLLPQGDECLLDRRVLDRRSGDGDKDMVGGCTRLAPPPEVSVHGGNRCRVQRNQPALVELRLEDPKSVNADVVDAQSQRLRDTKPRGSE